MKYTPLLLSFCIILTTAACADYTSNQKRGWFFGAFPPKSWPEKHWEGQSFQTQITDPQDRLPAAVDLNRSMFDDADLENLSPTEFVENLKQADIIDNVYRDEKFWRADKDKADMIVNVDYNFYTLSMADKTVIAELLSQSYGDELLTLRDTHTGRVIGHITPEDLVLF